MEEKKRALEFLKEATKKLEEINERLATQLTHEETSKKLIQSLLEHKKRRKRSAREL